MKRSHGIVLFALAAVNMVVLGAGLTALGTAIFAPAEHLPTLMAPVTFVPVAAATSAPGASATPAPARPTVTPSAEPTLEPTASPEVVESTPTAEPSATETVAPTLAPTETLVPASATAEAVSPPSATPTEAAAQAQVAPAGTDTPGPTDTPVPTEAPPPTATPVPTATGVPVLALNVPASYIIPAPAHTSQIFLQGKNLGNRANAFALVGDSNTDNPAFFAPFDNGNYNLGAYAYLQTTIGFFRGSFAQHSPAAVGSFNTSKVLDPAFADPARCLSGESPLVCEYRLQRPSVALILIGTGDHLDWANFEGRYRRILDDTLAQGIVPVLLTKADDLESKEQGAPYDFTNNVIRRLSREYDLPLLDLRRVVELLPNRGCGPDGFHYNTPPDGRSADFTGDHLNYGYNVRNLTALLALDEIRREVLQP